MRVRGAKEHLSRAFYLKHKCAVCDQRHVVQLSKDKVDTETENKDTECRRSQIK